VPAGGAPQTAEGITRGLGRSGGGCHVFVEGSGLADRGDREGEVRAWGRRPRMVGGSGGAWKILFVKKKKASVKRRRRDRTVGAWEW